MNNYRGYYPQQTSVAAQSTLIQKVSYLLATCLLCTAGAAWWASTAGLSPLLFWPLAIGTLVCVFAINMTRRNPAVSLVLLYGLSVLEGLLLGPMLGAIAHGFPYGAVIIEEAAALWESLSQNHPFVDGNKRTAFASVYTFLAINGLRLTAGAEQTIAFVIGLYQGNQFSFEKLVPWLRENSCVRM